MANTLVQSSELTEFPGAPFSQVIVDAAAAAVRGEAGWHIAPQVTETVKLDAKGGTLLYLPTRYLINVTAVRDVTGSSPVVLIDWRMSRNGKLYRAAGWPCGFQSAEIDMVHGYTTTPPDLLPVIADACRLADSDPRVSQESLGSWSTTLAAALAETDTGNVLARLTIPWGAR